MIMNARIILGGVLLWWCAAGCMTASAPIRYSEGGGGRNTASTRIEAPATTIYAAVLRVLKKNATETVILERNDTRYEIVAVKGLQRVQINVLPEGNSGKLNITSDAGKDNSPYTDQALITTEQVCNELGVPVAYL
jgi:hypothetical protein